MVKAKPKAARTAEARARSGDVTARVELFFSWLGAVASGKESLTVVQLLGLLSSAVAIAAVSFGVYLLTRSSVQALDASDTASLRRVFFSGDPWIVECTSRGRASPMVYEAESSLRGVAMGTLACDAKLPSGQTTFERFKLTAPSYGPVVLAASNMERPQIAPKTALASAATLTAWAKGATKAKLFNPSSGAQFESQCARKPWCLVVLTAGSRLADSERKALQSLAERERRLRIAKVDASVSNLIIELPSGVLPPPTASQSTLLLLKGGAPAKGAKAEDGEGGGEESGDETAGGPDGGLGMLLPMGMVDPAATAVSLSAALDGAAASELLPLPKRPFLRVKHRPTPSATPSPSSPSPSDPPSKTLTDAELKAMRADRERKIKEAEQQRRAKMAQEEASASNIVEEATAESEGGGGSSALEEEGEDDDETAGSADDEVEAEDFD